VGYFDVKFDGVIKPVLLSTGPHSSSTRWKQTTFFLSEPFNSHEGLSVMTICMCNDGIVMVTVVLYSFHPCTPLGLNILALVIIVPRK